jgi:tetratricopeptide (TPR) repeat protein
MSLGLGRGLITMACVVACMSGRAAAQTPPAAPSVAAQAPSVAAQAPAGAAEPQAQLPKVEPSLEARERARTAYAAGQASFAAGDFASALLAFKEAYANVPNPIVLLSIAESAAKVDQIETALAAYDHYLAARPDAPDRDDVVQKRAALVAGQAPAQVTITSEPPGADVILDGQLTGRVTPVTLEVRPGNHRVSLVLTGYDTERLALTLAPSAREQRAAVLKASPALLASQAAAAAAPPSTDAAPAVPVESPRAAIVVTASLGAAGVVAGTVLGIFALKERGDFNANPSTAGADRGERLALFSDVGFGIGAMSLITTAVLLFTHDDSHPSDAPKEGARLELTPSFTARGASATAKVRF